jgi:hypothetical protein
MSNLKNPIRKFANREYRTLKRPNNYIIIIEYNLDFE